jgi:hypothetical protein
MPTAGFEMAMAVQGQAPDAAMRWEKAGRKAGEAAMAGQVQIFVQVAPGTAYKYTHQNTVETELGTYSYYVHARSTQRPLVFRRIGTIYVSAQPKELKANGRVTFSAAYALSAGPLPDVTIPVKDATMAYFRQELQRLMAHDKICSEQTVIQFVPPVKGNQKISSAFKEALQLLTTKGQTKLLVVAV